MLDILLHHVADLPPAALVVLLVGAGIALLCSFAGVILVLVRIWGGRAPSPTLNPRERAVFDRTMQELSARREFRRGCDPRTRAVRPVLRGAVSPEMETRAPAWAARVSASEEARR